VLRYDKDKTMFEGMSKDAIIIMDINCQGIMDIDNVHVKFKKMFPETMLMLKPLFISGKMQVGEIIETEEGGYTILLIVTRNARVGKLKDDDEVVVKNTLDIIKDIETRLGKKPVVSSVLNRDIGKAWPAAQMQIINSNLDWTIRVR